jgi:hypothetical protein
MVPVPSPLSVATIVPDTAVCPSKSLNQEAVDPIMYVPAGQVAISLIRSVSESFVNAFGPVLTIRSPAPVKKPPWPLKYAAVKCVVNAPLFAAEAPAGQAAEARKVLGVGRGGERGCYQQKD